MKMLVIPIALACFMVISPLCIAKPVTTITSTGSGVKRSNISTRISSSHIFEGKTISNGPTINPKITIHSDSGVITSFEGALVLWNPDDYIEEGQFNQIIFDVGFEPFKAAKKSTYFGYREISHPARLPKTEEQRQADRSLVMIQTWKYLINNKLIFDLGFGGEIIERLYTSWQIAYETEQNTLGIKFKPMVELTSLREPGLQNGLHHLESSIKISGNTFSIKYVWLHELDEQVFTIAAGQDKKMVLESNHYF